MLPAGVVEAFPRPLASYPDAGGSIVALLADRVRLEPFNAVATGIFIVAIAHTFAAARFTAWAQAVQQERDARARREGRPAVPSVQAELLRFLGEVEVVFGLWAIVLFAALAVSAGWATAEHYFNETVNYTEAVFVVVIMALASSRPVVLFAESGLRRVANAAGGSPAAWWLTILVVAPLLGSFITEPAAMTIAALLLGRQFYDLGPGTRLKYATLGLLFVNVSIGGTLTHFAAPPVLMVARPWSWDTPFMMQQFGWKAAAAILVSTATYFVVFRRELTSLNGPCPPQAEEAEDETASPLGLAPVPFWVTAVHLGFMAWTVFTAHYRVLFLGGFLVFLGFVKATAKCQSRIDLKAPFLVGFFLAGLVIHGGLQGWWIAPVLGRLSETPLFLSSTLLTALNDNALITYLATLVPNLDDQLKTAIVGGAVTGGGLTVIANAPNPAGQALLGRFFDGAIMPLKLLAGALVPTLIAALAFRLL